jgi:hypothetical protein
VLVGLILMAAGGYVAFGTPTQSLLQVGIVAGVFGLGLAIVGGTLLPGELTFKRRGIIATSGFALFLIVWFALKGSVDSSDTSVISPAPLTVAASFVSSPRTA